MQEHTTSDALVTQMLDSWQPAAIYTNFRELQTSRFYQRHHAHS